MGITQLFHDRFVLRRANPGGKYCSPLHNQARRSPCSRSPCPWSCAQRGRVLQPGARPGWQAAVGRLPVPGSNVAEGKQPWWPCWLHLQSGASA